MIFAPPRHGKSFLSSIYFPAYYLHHHPDDRVAIASYDFDLASGWGRKVREVIEEHSSVSGLHVNAQQGAGYRWDIDHHWGGMYATSLYGSFTGRGANLLLIDDPIKDAVMARSKRHRDNAWDWWSSVAERRLEPGASVILTLTRWHEDDLAGRLLASEESEWEVVRLPALAEDDDPLGREPGEALWPARYDREALEQMRDGASLAGVWWAALYQQRPAPAEGTLFLRSGERRFYEDGDSYVLIDGIEDDGTVHERRVNKNETYAFLTVDLAFTVATSSDFTVISTWAATSTGDLIWLDCQRQRMEGTEHIANIRAKMIEHRATLACIEATQAQISTVQHARLEGLPVKAVHARGDKWGRAQAGAAKWNAGKIFMPKLADWTHLAIEELIVFNHGAHDDIVDTVSYAGTEALMHSQASSAYMGVVECAGCRNKFVGKDPERACPRCGSKDRV